MRLRMCRQRIIFTQTHTLKLTHLYYRLTPPTLNLFDWGLSQPPNIWQNPYNASLRLNVNLLVNLPDTTLCQPSNLWHNPYNAHLGIQCQSTSKPAWHNSLSTYYQCLNLPLPISREISHVLHHLSPNPLSKLSEPSSEPLCHSTTMSKLLKWHSLNLDFSWHSRYSTRWQQSPGRGCIQSHLHHPLPTLSTRNDIENLTETPNFTCIFKFHPT